MREPYVWKRVRLRDLDANETLEYVISGSAIANPASEPGLLTRWDWPNR